MVTAIDPETGPEAQRVFSADWGFESEEVVLYGARCTACSGKWFPKTNNCPICLSDQVEQVTLSKEGKLYSFSIVRVDASGMKAPYAIGYVDLLDGPRVFAQVLGWEDERLKPDVAVQLTYGPLPLKHRGGTVLTYKFEPLNNARKHRS